MQEYKKTMIDKDQIVPIAERMRKNQVWLTMIHAFLTKEVLPSIGGIYDVAAEWPEREINELFGVTFEGLDVSQRLFLPEDMLETQGKGQIMVTPLSELRKKNREEAAE